MGDGDRHEPEQRALALAAAALFLLGGLTGFYVAGAQTGKVAVDPGAALASHLNALQGAFWLLGLGWSLRFVSLGEGPRRLLVRLSVLAAYANWLVTAVKAALKVHGVDWTGEAANDAIFVVLTLTVVFPTLAASALWVHGLRRHA